MNLQRKIQKDVKKDKKYVDKWQMLKEEDKVVAGVSGGADSICLLLYLWNFKKKSRLN